MPDGISINVDKRFPITQTSERKKTEPYSYVLEDMKFIRDTLTDVQKEIPLVRGVAFLGSRTVGKEQEITGKKSDLDIVVFYNGSDFIYKPAIDVSLPNGELIFGAGRILIQQGQDIRSKDFAKQQLFDSIFQKYSELLKSRGLPIDYEKGKNKTIMLIDISKLETDNQIQVFKSYADANIRPDGHVIADGINGVTFPLVSRFFLAAGAAVYENRAYILNILEQTEKSGQNGEFYFRAIMDSLRGLDISDEQRNYTLPKTIAEARSYFSQKSNLK